MASPLHNLTLEEIQAMKLNPLAPTRRNITELSGDQKRRLHPPPRCLLLDFLPVLPARRGYLQAEHPHHRMLPTGQVAHLEPTQHCREIALKPSGSKRLSCSP
ncbi:hypothetical protein H0H81_005236 [Sphagnurus paluster]|uniref:Uncharacterized protein n=1 Tax=Sphagnurus paluster TaxID=117069 RepID=A0A9P7GKN7_9AGAR|nr:hypothetical protein H0H81_005236 [Sphagnurus paluster]